MRHLLWVAALLVICPLSGICQDSADSWGNLKQLKAGQKIEVVDTNLNKVKARFRAHTEDGMTIEVKHKKKMELARNQIVMVKVRPSWFKQLLAGLVVGAILGAEAWVEADHEKRERAYENDEDEHGLSTRTLPYFAAGGAGLFGIAAAFSDGSEGVIYFHNPTPPRYESPIEPHIYDEDAGQPEGGNVFIPKHPQGDRENKSQENNLANPD